MIIEPDIPGKMVKKPSKAPQKRKSVKKSKVSFGYSKNTGGVGILKQERKKIKSIPKKSQKRVGFCFSCFSKSGIENKTNPLNKKEVP